MSEGRVFVIAEAGVNHNGNLESAVQMVRVAAQAGADAVKFQTFRTEEVVTSQAPRAEYQKASNPQEASLSQYELIKRLELAPEVHHGLVRECERVGIRFLSTPFDLVSLRFLVNDLKLPCLKIGSGDLTFGPLLLEAGRSLKPVILSTGMATLLEIREALGVLAFGYLDLKGPCRAAFAKAFESAEGREILKEKVTLLHCTTEYPAPFDELNLRAMTTLREQFGLAVGFSDHSAGILAPLAATALGARVIEKHFTLDKGLPGPDHRASLDPDEFAQMIQGIRAIELSLGTGEKVPSSSEAKNRSIARRSLVAAKAIEAGAVFTPEALALKRPGTGISPMDYWDTLGLTSPRAFEREDLITLK